MRERPDGAELLATARELLRQELLPLLPKDKAYQALMIANAMGIAERQLQAGSVPQAKEQAELVALLGQEGELPVLTRAFAQGIRRGEFDHNAEAQQLLWQSVLQRVRESTPKVLAAYGLK